VAQLTIHYGKVHEYLGMTIDHSEVNKVRITMINYIKNMLSEAPEEMGGVATIPAANFLYEINENPEFLEKRRLTYLTQWCKITLSEQKSLSRY
jgi:hypothetical protein